MDNISDDFVDRTEEVKNFRGLINDQRHRLLLIFGLQGRGKSYLARQFHRISNTEQMTSVVMDFQNYTMLTEPEEIINHLIVRLGSNFAECMEQAEADVTRQRARHLKEFGKILSEALSASPPGRGGGVTMDNIDEVKIGGDVVGGDKVSVHIGSLYTNPDGGTALGQMSTQLRRNLVFRTALKNFLADQKRVIFFFDHFDAATTPVKSWVSDQMLSLILEEVEGYVKMWIVVAGVTVPHQEKRYQLQDVLRSQRVNSLPDDAVHLFWVDARGVAKTKVDECIQETKGNTKLLFQMLYQYVEDSDAEQRDG